MVSETNMPDVSQEQENTDQTEPIAETVETPEYEKITQEEKEGLSRLRKIIEESRPKVEMKLDMELFEQLDSILNSEPQSIPPALYPDLIDELRKSIAEVIEGDESMPKLLDLLFVETEEGGTITMYKICPNLKKYELRLKFDTAKMKEQVRNEETQEMPVAISIESSYN